MVPSTNTMNAAINASTTIPRSCSAPAVRAPVGVRAMSSPNIKRVAMFRLRYHDPERYDPLLVL